MNFDVTFIEGVADMKNTPAVIDRTNCEGEVVISSNYNEININENGVTVFVAYPTSGGLQPLPATVPDSVSNVDLFVKYDGSLIQKTANRIPLVFYFRSECNGENVLNQKVDGISVTIADALAKPLDVELNVEHITEIGKADGIIRAIKKGGSGNYNYSWKGPNGFSRNGKHISKIENLEAGLYTLTLTDIQTGEIIESEVNVYNPLNANFIVQNASGKGRKDGSINLTPEGGSGYYRYEWLGPEGFFTTDEVPQADLPEIESDEHFFELSVGSFQNYLFRNGPEDITGLGAGRYQVTILDSVTGLRKVNTIEITEPRLEVRVSTVDITEHGGDDGEIYVEASKGSGIYQFDWTGPNNFISGPNTGSSDHLEGLVAGIYCLRVRDQNLNEYAFEKIEIKEPSLTLIKFHVTNPSSSDANDGQIEARAIGGFGPFDWTWNGSNTNSNILFNVSPGEYTVTATDRQTGEIVQNSIIINVDNVCTRMQVNLQPTHNTCNTSATPNGAITASVTGGSGNYRYTWTGPCLRSRNVSVQSPSGLKGGIYQVVVSDLDTGRTVRSYAEVKNTPFTVNLIGTNPSQKKARDGRIDAIVNGCSGRYRYFWFGIEPNCSVQTNTPIVTNLRAGEYSLKVQDLVTNDTASASITLTDENEGIVTYFKVKNTTGESERDGAIDMEVKGGSGLFDYVWTTEEGFSSVYEDLNNIEHGVYKLKVTDRIETESTTDNVEVQNSPYDIKFEATVKVDHISEFGRNDGSIIVFPSGGKAPYSYIWSRNGNILIDQERNGIANNLEPGYYNITVIDSCDNITEVKTSVASPQPDKLNICMGGRNISEEGKEDGVVYAQVSGGYPPYSYRWYQDGELFLDEDTSPADGTLASVPAGEYLVEVTDSVCQKEGALLVIPDPADDPCFGERAFEVQGITSSVVLGPNQTETEILIDVVRGECCRCCEDPIKVDWAWDNNFTGGIYVDGQMTMWGETKFAKCGESDTVQTLRLKVYYKPNEIGLSPTWPAKQISQNLSLTLTSICDSRGVPVEFTAPEEVVNVRVLNDANVDLDAEYEFRGCSSC